MKSKRKYGIEGKNAVVQYLEKLGRQVIERSFRTSSGEIDIICKIENGFAFIEVKTRKATKFGLPIEAITKSKRANIIKVAKQYLITIDLYDKCDVRFDIAEVYDDKELIQINYIENAFIAND